MSESRSAARLIPQLQQRVKELACTFQVEEILSKDPDVVSACRALVEVIPAGWQYSDVCVAELTYAGERYFSRDFSESIWNQHADIVIHGAAVGRLTVHYTKDVPLADKGPFLKEEAKLIDAIAQRLSFFLLHQQLKNTFKRSAKRTDAPISARQEWRLAVDLLRKTDLRLLNRIARKLVNQLAWFGVEEAKDLLIHFGTDLLSEDRLADLNQPLRKSSPSESATLVNEVFQLASAHLSDDDILRGIQKWIHEDKSSFLVKAVINGQLALHEIVNVVRRYKYLSIEQRTLSEAAINGVVVGLIRRFFTEQLEFINVGKKYIQISDFFDVIERIILSPSAHGKLGGKSAGVFLASLVLKRSTEAQEAPPPVRMGPRAAQLALQQASASNRNTPSSTTVQAISAPAALSHFANVKTPKTWYISSNGVLDFLQYNDFEEVYEQKYKDINEVRNEYPHIIQVFKNSSFPPEVVSGLSMALDDFGEVPLIVRSSSLLEDRFGAAFSGKYKSLFLANQGSKRERLDALTDAIAEIYASTFGPDPIEYRAERGLLDFNEEMGILIQEVVGKRAGRFFFPAFAGVAFSNNEFRWSPRIDRTDGLLRLVPGLGTRAVDRLGDDYPILIAPGKPTLRVNVTLDEMLRYSPQAMDVIDLEDNCLVTKDVVEVLREVGADFPGLRQVVSTLKEGILGRPHALTTDFQKDDFIVTFEGLFSTTPFIAQVARILTTLEDALDTPVDIEFAHDGENLFLLQCRPQVACGGENPVVIPHPLPLDRTLFTAEKFITTAKVSDITHIVYVDPDAYNAITDLDTLVDVGRAVSKLNKALPRRRFILMGPGRWGSRGDIKLGVKVTYSDINNTALLIEIARRKGNYVPDLSFGTHFFQDLVEAAIRYLPLYPDDAGIVFNQSFFLDSPNALAALAPEFAHLADTVRVIHVPACCNGLNLNVLMDGERDLAVALLGEGENPALVFAPTAPAPQAAHFESWPIEKLRELALYLDHNTGIETIYLLPREKGAATPKPHAALIVTAASLQKQQEIRAWLETWNDAMTKTLSLMTKTSLPPLFTFSYKNVAEASQAETAAQLRALANAGRQIAVGPPH